MSFRDWSWSFTSGRCHSSNSDLCDFDNGTWKSPDRQQFYCWKHYQQALRNEVDADVEAVKAERIRIANGLMAWLEMWTKPNRLAFSNKTVPASDSINKSWLKEFADKIRDGTFGKPHSSEPDPLY